MLTPCESPSPMALDPARLDFDAAGGLVRLVTYERVDGELTPFPVSVLIDGRPYPLVVDDRTGERLRGRLIKALGVVGLTPRRQRELTRGTP